MVCGMDQSAFYGIVSGISFTLQGLWWVAVRERPDLLGGDARDGAVIRVDVIDGELTVTYENSAEE